MERTLRTKIDLLLVTFIISLYLFRTTIPFLKYPFIILLFLATIYVFIEYRTDILRTLRTFVNTYILVLILVLVLLGAFIFSDKIYLLVFKDLADVVILLLLYFLCSLIIRTGDDIQFFIHHLIKVIIFFALCISVFGLLRLFEIFKFGDHLMLNGNALITSTDSAKVDPNFALLPVFFGMLGVFSFYLKSVERQSKVFFNCLLILFSLQIVFSGSRRGLIMLICAIVFLTVMQFFSFAKTDSLFKRIGKVSQYFLVLSGLLIILASLFVSYSSFSFRLRALSFMGSKNIIRAKENITGKLYRYNGIINKTCAYEDLYSRIWTPRYNPIDPDCGWGNWTHKTIFPLSGENVGIVPKEAKGYYMDSTCEAGTWSGHAFSYTQFENIGVHEHDVFSASVYCYVSTDFNGAWARLSFDGSTKGQIRGDFDYDLTKKGRWQKLSGDIDCSEGKIITYLYFCKTGVTDFSTLKGYVIFAYPQIHINERIDTVTSDLNKITNQNKINKQNAESFQRTKLLLNSYPTKDCFISQNGEFLLENERQNKLGFNTLRQASFFNIPLGLNLSFIQPIIEKDPLRNWVAGFISEDTTYKDLHMVVKIDSIKNRFSDLRLVRWKFAFQIYKNEYNWPKKLVGGGFNFLNWYGYYFFRDKTKSDYPHNPFLHILLYSGIFGLSIYLIFIYKVFSYYIKYIRNYPLIFIFFLITFYFTFFSGGSPFDPPIMGFFAILPFFFHSVHKSENKEISD